MNCLCFDHDDNNDTLTFYAYKMNALDASLVCANILPFNASQGYQNIKRYHCIHFVLYFEGHDPLSMV